MGEEGERWEFPGPLGSTRLGFGIIGWVSVGGGPEKGPVRPEGLQALRGGRGLGPILEHKPLIGNRSWKAPGFYGHWVGQLYFRPVAEWPITKPSGSGEGPW